MYEERPCKGIRSYGGGKRIDPWYSAGYLYSSLTVTAGRDVCPTSWAATIRIDTSVLSSLHDLPSNSSLFSRLLHCAKSVHHDCRRRPPQQHRALFSRSIWTLWNIAPSVGGFVDSRQVERAFKWPEVKRVSLRFVRRRIYLQRQPSVGCVTICSRDPKWASRLAV